MIKFYKSKGEFGSLLSNFAWAYNEDGWEAWECFTSAEAFDKHCANAIEAPLAPDIWVLQDYFKEVTYHMQGLEAEVSKSVKIKEYYPDHKWTD